MADSSIDKTPGSPQTEQFPPFEFTSAVGSAAKKKKSFWKFLLVVGLTAVAGYFGAQLFLQALSGSEESAERVRLSGLQKSVFIILLPVQIFVVILIHELGHVLGGKLAGLRFLLLIVGPLKVVRDGSRLSWQVNRSAGLMGGLACCLPTTDCDFLKALRIMIVGGPLSSLLLAVLCFGLWLATPSLNLDGSWQRFLSGQLFFVMAMSTMIFFVTSYPRVVGGMKTDGKQFLELLKSGPETERQNLVRLLVGQSLAGLRPSEWDKDIIKKLDEAYEHVEDTDAKRSERLIWSSMRGAVAFDDQDNQVAHDCLQYTLTHSDEYPVFARGTLYLAASLFESRVRRDADRAEALIQAAPEGLLVEAYLPLAAQAEVHQLRQETEKARACAQRAIDKMQSAIDAGGAASEKEAMLEILNGQPTQGV